MPYEQKTQQSSFSGRKTAEHVAQLYRITQYSVGIVSVLTAPQRGHLMIDWRTITLFSLPALLAHVLLRRLRTNASESRRFCQ